MMRSSLESVLAQIESEKLDDPATLWERLTPSLGHDRFALCALGPSRARFVGQATWPAGL